MAVQGRTRILSVLLAAVAILAIFLNYEKYAGNWTSEPVEKQVKAKPAEVRVPEDITGFREYLGGPESPKEDYVGRWISLFPSSYEDSKWQQNEAERHAASVGPGKYDYIVLPLQTSRPAVDRPGSLLSAHHLAWEVQQQTGKSVMSPELALRAMGGRADFFVDEDVIELANGSGAQVVHVYLLKRKRKGEKPRLVLTLMDTTGKVLRSSTYHVEKRSLANLFDDQVEKAAPDIVSDFFATAAKSPVDKATVAYESWTLPDTLSEIPELSVSPGNSAAYLQFLAMLTPEEFGYDRRRLFERSLVALKSLDPAHPHYRLLRSRALFHLARRPGAIDALGSVDSSAEKAFAQLLKGNYTDMKALTPYIEDPLLRAVASIELATLGVEYDKAHMDPYEDAELAPQWQALFESAYRDADEWYVPENFVFFSQLSGLFPEFDEAMLKEVQGNIVSGDFFESGQYSEILNMVIERELVSPKASGCCPEYGPAVEESDIWTLYRNLFLGNMLRDVNRSVGRHASYKTALKKADEYEPYLSGHPRYSRLYAQAASGLARNNQGKKRDEYTAIATDMAWETRFNSAYSDIDTWLADKVLRHHDGNHGRRFAGARGDIPSALHYGTTSPIEEVIPFFHDTLFYLKTALSKGYMTEDEMIEHLSNHLNGHPEKAAYLAGLLINKGERDKAVSLLEGEVALGVENPEPYTRLGKLLLADRDYTAAQKVFLSYPAFKDPAPQQPVGVSNTAERYGNLFYWRGDYEDAIPFYEFAAELGTGAYSYYMSMYRLALVSGDYVAAGQHAFNNARRYNNARSYAYYLTLLHMMGKHEDAEAGARTLIPRFDHHPIWESLLIGDRMQEKSLADIEAWMNESVDFDAKPELKYRLQAYMFLRAMSDREVSPESIAEVAQFFISEAAWRSGDEEDGGSFEPVSAIVQPYMGKPAPVSASCDDEIGECTGEVETGLTGNLMEFLVAYQFLRAGDSQAALEALVQFDRDRDIVRNQFYALSYLAMAATAALEPEGVQALLDYIEQFDVTDAARFDLELSKAVIYATLGKKDEAVEALEQAYHGLPDSYDRPMYTWHQLAESAEWMSGVSGHPVYVELALEKTRRYQVIGPQYGWAYAFEALYSKETQDRVRAAAFAQHLDPESRWLSEVPPEIKDEAAAWWKINNPFSEKALARAAESTQL